jgi:hypothetical protein
MVKCGLKPMGDRALSFVAYSLDFGHAGDRLRYGSCVPSLSDSCGAAMLRHTPPKATCSPKETSVRANRAWTGLQGQPDPIAPKRTISNHGSLTKAIAAPAPPITADTSVFLFGPRVVSQRYYPLD